MNEDKAREIVKEDRGFGGCDPEGMYEYGKANGFLAGLEQEREKASAILRNREDRIKILEEIVSNEIDKNKSSRQEIERLKKDYATLSLANQEHYTMLGEAREKLEVERQAIRDLLEAERQSTRELVAAAEKVISHYSIVHKPSQFPKTAGQVLLNQMEEILSRHKAGGKAT